MDNKQIRKVIQEIILQHTFGCDCLCCREDGKIDQALAQLFLSVKGMPKKKVDSIPAPNTPLTESDILAKYMNFGYNLCHDEFTAWLAGRVEGIEKAIRNFNFTTNDFLHNLKPPYDNKLSEGIARELATAIKTMIMGEKE